MGIFHQGCQKCCFCLAIFATGSRNRLRTPARADQRGFPALPELGRIFYLASHGSPNNLHVGDDITGLVTLDEITSALAGRLGYNDVVVHLGGCELLQASKKSLRSMKTAIKARLLSGYTKQVGFLDSMLLEMAWFSFLQQKGAFDSFPKFLVGPHGKLIQKLGFEVI